MYQEKNGPLGLSLGGGRGWPLGSIPLFISTITKGGVAARAGVLKVSVWLCRYAYYPVNVSRAVGPRIVDRVINNLSNDYFIIDLQFPTMLNFLRLLVFEIISCDLSDSSDWPINSHEHLPCERTLCSHWTTSLSRAHHVTMTSP